MQRKKSQAILYFMECYIISTLKYLFALIRQWIGSYFHLLNGNFSNLGSRIFFIVLQVNFTGFYVERIVSVDRSRLQFFTVGFCVKFSPTLDDFWAIFSQPNPSKNSINSSTISRFLKNLINPLNHASRKPIINSNLQI